MASTWVLSRSSSKLPCAGLICSLRLANFVALKDGDLVSELFVDRLDSMDLLAHGVDLGLQLQGLFDLRAGLFRGYLVEIGQESHTVYVTKAALVLQLKGAFKAM